MDQPPRTGAEPGRPLGERGTRAEQWLALLRQLEPLKHLPRSGWVDREVSAPESVAAHSWRLAMLAWLVATEEGLDAAYAMQLALVHDVPEAITGDQTPFDALGATAAERRQLATHPPAHDQWHAAEMRTAKHEAERRALAQIVAGATPAMARRISALWEEYAAESSPEARLVHQLDKLEAYLQGWEYARDGRLADPETLRSFRVDSARLTGEPAARALLHVIEQWADAARLDEQGDPTPE